MKNFFMYIVQQSYTFTQKYEYKNTSINNQTNTHTHTQTNIYTHTHTEKHTVCENLLSKLYNFDMLMLSITQPHTRTQNKHNYTYVINAYTNKLHPNIHINTHKIP